MQRSLDDAWDKLRWAKKHFESLRSQIEPFEQRDAHSFRAEIDPQAGKYEFYVSGLQVADPDWGLMIGDCLHNARTALDYVTVQLWALVTNQDPVDVTHVQFPVYDDPKEFAAKVGKLRKEPLFSGYLARIEELQPFNSWNPSIWGWEFPVIPAFLPNAIRWLSQLDVIDKHRRLHPAWLTASNGWIFQIIADAPDGFEAIGGRIIEGPLVDDTKVGEFTFKAPLPHEWEPTQVQMKGYFPLQVAFPHPPSTQRVLEVLPWCISGAEAVISIFAPVFDGKTPLPVTAVRTIRG